MPWHPGRQRSPSSFPLLADKPMRWESLEQDPPHLRLRGVVGLGDEVAWPLGGGLEAADPLLKHAAAGPGSRLAGLKRIGRG